MVPSSVERVYIGGLMDWYKKYIEAGKKKKKKKKKRQPKIPPSGKLDTQIFPNKKPPYTL